MVFAVCFSQTTCQRKGVQADGGLKFSMAQKKLQKLPVGGQKFNPWTDDFFRFCWR